MQVLVVTALLLATPHRAFKVFQTLCLLCESSLLHEPL